MNPGGPTILVLMVSLVAVICIAFVALDRVWHSTVTPHNAERIAPVAEGER